MEKYPATPAPFTEDLNVFLNPFFVFYMIFLAFYLPLISIFIRRRATKDRRKMLISKVIEDIIEIRRMLKDNNNSTRVFSNNWKIETIPAKKGLNGYLDKKWREYKTFRGNLLGIKKPLLPSEKKEVQDYIQKKHIQDYIILDDFYTELDERNQALSKNLTQEKLEKSNKYLLELANDALQKINWEKYN